MLHANDITFLLSRPSSLANTPTTLFSEKLRLLPTAAVVRALEEFARAASFFALFAWTTRSETCCEQKRRKQVCFSPNRRRVEWASGGERRGRFCHAKKLASQCIRWKREKEREKKRAFHSRLVGRRRAPARGRDLCIPDALQTLATHVRKRRENYLCEKFDSRVQKSMPAFCWRRDCPNYRRRRPLSIQWILQNLLKQTSDPIDSSHRNVNKTGRRRLRCKITSGVHTSYVNIWC